jgi:hypothetical protein
VALKHPGKNAPLDDDTKRKLFALGKAVDVDTTPPRTRDIVASARPYTLEEMTMLINGAISSPFQLLELPWDERLSSALADRAMNAKADLAVVLLAGSGRYDEARALYDRIDPDIRVRFRSGGGHASLAVGDFEVPAIASVRHLRLSTMGTIVRFRPIADRIAGAADALLAKLPDFFAGSGYEKTYAQIWSPTLRSFALLAERDEKVIDAGYTKLLAELSSVAVPKHHGFTYEDKREALRTMFTLAMHQKRLLSAHRIAAKFGSSLTTGYRLLVAAEYARAQDLGGAWEIAGKVNTSRGPWFDHLAQVLHEHAS